MARQFSDRPDIDTAAQKLKMTMGGKREIKRLPEALWEGETVSMLAVGQYGGGQGIAAMTDRRLLFFKHGITGQSVTDFPYANISSVEWHGGLASGTLVVYAAGHATKIEGMNKADGRALADVLRTLVSGTVKTAGTPAGIPAAPQQDVAARLATLDQLRAVGAISDQEYRDRRAAIIASI